MTTEETFLTSAKKANKIMDEAITDDKKQGYILIAVECDSCGTQQTTTIASSQMSTFKNANAAFTLLRKKYGRMLIGDMLKALSTSISNAERIITILLEIC